MVILYCKSLLILYFLYLLHTTDVIFSFLFFFFFFFFFPIFSFSSFFSNSFSHVMRNVQTRLSHVHKSIAVSYKSLDYLTAVSGVGSSQVLFAVCQVVFLGDLPFSPHLLIGPSHMN